MPRRTQPLDLGEVRAELSHPGPYEAEQQGRGTGQSLVAAGGATIALWLSGGLTGQSVLFAANHRSELVASKAAVMATGGSLPPGTGNQAEARPGVMANLRTGIADMTLYEGKDRPMAHGFSDPNDAQTIADSIQTLGWLRDALFHHVATPRADRGPDLSAALDGALDLVRGWQAPDLPLEFERRLRAATADADQPTGTNGFRNPGWKQGELCTRVELRTMFDAANQAIPSIAVNWAFWGSPEFRIEFPSSAAGSASARATIKAIWERYAPDADRLVVGRDPWELARESGASDKQGGFYRVVDDIRIRQSRAAQGDFSRYDMTLTPDMVADLLPPEAKVRFTPQSLASREQMLRLGADVFRREDVLVPAEDIVGLAARPISREPNLTQAAPAAPARSSATSLFRNRAFDVLDHGAMGVEVRFCSANSEPGVAGSKWFLDAAATQIREFIDGNPARRAAMLLEQRIGEPLSLQPGRGR